MTPNPLMAELMNHIWAMEEGALKAFMEQMTHWTPEASLPAVAVAYKSRTLRIDNGIAVINISGVLLKSVPGWLRLWGLEATGYNEIAEQLREALGSEQVTGIHLQVSSPGGVVDGLAEVADAIFNARGQKPVTATIEDLGASAAYWLGSQAETIEAGRTAQVGSIGVYTVYADMSKRAEELGIKVIVIKSGEHKGMGVPGAEITEEQIAAKQEVVDAIADNFIGAVAAGRGRKKTEVKGWASGRLWIAKTALEMGLIDTVTVNNVQNVENIKSKGQSMDTEKQNSTEAEEKAKAQIKAADEQARADEQKRLGELKATFPDDLEFAVKAFGEGKSVLEARAEYCDVLEKRLKEKKTAEAKGKVPGAQAISSEDTDNEASGGFMVEARQLVEDGKAKNMTIAMRKVARSNPASHEAYKEKCRVEGVAVYSEVA